MKRLSPFLLLCLFVIGLSEPSIAHKASDSYLRLKVEGDRVRGQWDIALRDLDYAISLDRDDDGTITWGELRQKHQPIENYAFSRLQIRGNDSPCWHQPLEQQVDHHTDGAYAVLFFHVVCSQSIRNLEIDYNLLFDLDPLHRGLLQVNHDGLVQTGVLSPEKSTILLDLRRHDSMREFLQFGREGIWHIWIGYDHILFLLSLLLPAVLCRRDGRWCAQEAFRPTLYKVLKIVTAFTLAHSITLSLAASDIVSLPSRWVESTIAASVLVAALHNLYPIFRTRLWIITFLFGLIHGLGFASVLIDLGLPGQSLILALAGFNLGVEIGQVVIVGLFIPLAFLIRRSWSYQHLVLNFGSIMIAFLASAWLLERSLNVNLGMGVW